MKSKILAMLAVALLAGCGGGNGDSSANIEVPGLVDSFTAYVAEIGRAADEISPPIDIDTVVATSPETTEPTFVSQ